MDLNRREILGTIVTAPVIVLSGCSTFESNDKILQLSVFNTTNDGHSIDVNLAEGGNTVIDQNMDIDAEGDSGSSKIVTKIHNSPLNKPNPEIQVELDDRIERETSLSFPSDSSAPGYIITVRILDGPEINIESSLISDN